MNNREREMLAEAAVPLEVVCEQLLKKPYTEMTEDLQKQLLCSRTIIRGILFNKISPDKKGQPSDKNGYSSPGSGISAGFLLFLVFLVLKLCDVINWSWWWVTAPLWIPVSLLLVMLLAFGVVSLALEYVSQKM